MSLRVVAPDGKEYTAVDIAAVATWLRENRIRPDWVVINDADGSRRSAAEVAASAPAPSTSVAPGPGRSEVPTSPFGTQGQPSIGQPSVGTNPQPGQGQIGGSLLLIHPNGKHYGPMTPQVLAQWVAESRAMTTWLVFDTASQTQKPVAQVLQEAGMVAISPYPRGTYDPVKGSGAQLGTLSIILGGVSFIACCIPYVGLGLALSAIVTGYLAKKNDRSMGTPGIILGAVALVLIIAFFILQFSLERMFRA